MNDAEDFICGSLEGSIAKHNADLGLFNQLLQMVDGDWADSVQGICNHIHHRLRSLGLTLSVYDPIFNEFIYISYSINHDIEKIMTESGLSILRGPMVDFFIKIYKNHPDILEEKVFDEKYIEKLAEIIITDPVTAKSILGKLGLKALTAIQAPVSYKQYKCYFHILSDRGLSEAEKGMINDYMPQLNVALEIVFFVRDLYIKATHDGLTRLFDHRQGLILLGRELDRVKRNKQPLTLAMLDLDHFKMINDTYGHQAGDMVLQYIGALLTDCLRKSDIISRYGGEEFLIALTDTPIRIAQEVIQRSKDSLEKHVFIHGEKSFSITASIGMAEYDPAKHDDYKEFIEATDTMLYRAKENGRNRIEY